MKTKEDDLKLSDLQADLVRELIRARESQYNQEQRDCTAAQGMGHMLTIDRINKLETQLGLSTEESLFNTPEEAKKQETEFVKCLERSNNKENT